VQISSPQFIFDLRELAQAGLAANPNTTLIAAVVQFTAQVPSLRVIIDHLPQMEPPAESQARSLVRTNLRELGTRSQLYVKVSEVLRRVDGQVPYTLSFYRARLDELWEIFGPDRLMLGSDWPHSDRWGTYPQILEIVREYFLGKSQAAAEKFFWKNSIAAYRWMKREKNRPQTEADAFGSI
jgi:predicted TIM-barrel fold metal-dependent hydrolase